MNTEQTSKNIFTYIKTHYGETILAKIGKLEKTMIKYSSYTNHLRFSLRCHHNKTLLKDLQLKSRIKTERSKIILQRAGKKPDDGRSISRNVAHLNVLVHDVWTYCIIEKNITKWRKTPHYNHKKLFSFGKFVFFEQAYLIFLAKQKKSFLACKKFFSGQCK